MVIEAAIAYKMCKIRELYGEIKNELDVKFFTNTGVITYYFSAFFPSFFPRLREKYPPPLGLVVSPTLLDKMNKLCFWDIDIIDQPKIAKRYVGISAHLHPTLAKHVMKLCLEQESLGVARTDKPLGPLVSIQFKSMSESRLERFLRNYKYSRDF